MKHILCDIQQTKTTENQELKTYFKKTEKNDDRQDAMAVRGHESRDRGG
jgi:hypothetical protein